MAGDYPEDSELGHRGPVIYRNGNAQLNKVIWAVAAILVSGYIGLQVWTTQRLVDTQLNVASRLARIEERLGIGRERD